MGVERADSWATDAHKWLNTPYDCGIAICAHPDAHRRAMGVRAAYLPEGGDAGLRDPIDYNPELSRRARSVPVWAAIRQLGRRGVADLVERCCRMAERLADLLREADGVEVLHQELNQVVARFMDPAGRDHDAHSRAVVARTQAEGTCYPSGTMWRGVAAVRLSVTSWRTGPHDVDRTVRRSWPRTGAGGLTREQPASPEARAGRSRLDGPRDGGNDLGDVLAGQVRVHRQREGGAGALLGHRQVALGVAQPREHGLQVHRDAVVDGAADRRRRPARRAPRRAAGGAP